MRRTFSIMILIFIIIALVVSVMPAAAQAEMPKLQHIFIISVDGLSQEGFISSSVPSMKHLAGEGVIDENCLGIRAETPEAAQASLLTGTLPDEHKYYSSKDRPQIASFLDVLKQGGRSFMVLDGSGGKLQAFDYGAAHYLCLDSAQTDREVLEKAAEVFSRQKAFYNHIVLNDCREAKLTLDEKLYCQTIANTDSAIGDFLVFLRNEKLYYNSIIIVTSPCSCSLSDKVPLIIHGPCLQAGTRINNSMIVDVIPTLAMLSGLKVPAGSRGIPLYDALLYTSEERGSQLQKWVKALQQERSLYWQQNYQLQDEIYRNYNRISSMKEERQNIFEYAGQKEDIIAGLKQRVKIERYVFCAIIALLLLGYGAEYAVLKKKYLLFK